MLTQQTLESLRQLRLQGMADAYQAQLQQPATSALSFDERFGLLVDREWTARQDRRLARLLKAAHLKLPACPEDIDYAAPRGLDRALVHELAGARWVREHHNVLLSGPTGSGKTYLACALAQATCRQGLSARYYRVSRLLAACTLAQGDGSYPRLLRQLAGFDLLVLDDWGLAPLTPAQSRDLLDILDDRCETHATLVASQVPPDHWHALLADPTIADAILDRLIHTAHILLLKGDSLRKASVPLRSADGSAT
jgi:DNA replication protein DnaC